ncbi:MAG: hypothetical protein L6W00_15685 [Lentisphaeria bacterium]|nr:MAG: hypothetical protein L6W00_15685 [Lentisphaeria bacterium]
MIRYFLESGRGVEIRILSPYGTPPVETALLEMPEFASTPVCALYHSLPGRQAERFQFELRPLAGTEPAPAGFGRVEQGASRCAAATAATGWWKTIRFESSSPGSAA